MVLGPGGAGKSQIVKGMINFLDDECVVASYMAAAT
jgi:ABC-type Mn2+/Zn2+ transport system ATPase subunit